MSIAPSLRRPVVHDLTLGVLMLDTRFPRFPGEIGNGRTWPVPLQFKVVRGATPERVVDRAGEGLLEPFIEAARELVDLGVHGITTSCGFLALFQRELSEALPVPVATSALLQTPLVEAMLPRGRRVGILTFNADALTARHLAAAGVDPSTPIEGMPADSLFRRVFSDSGLDDAPDFAVLKAEMVRAACLLVKRRPEVGAILCECTNMPPFAAAVNAATGLPVFDVVTLIRWFVLGLQPRRPF
ncbi:aspartate/glutamate racemase family protein [Paraburkholderia ferrariae]|uniref:aspartate/glutamate racemase family protein n=1 Tax=Paraburkholderia ferrariae TaxID=386056 RepID=UPI0004877A47|nr:aspartate/glutamate racemase family protein [Paraburkholderia ferrariae]